MNEVLGSITWAPGYKGEVRFAEDKNMWVFLQDSWVPWTDQPQPSVDWDKHGPRLYAALKALTVNNHMNLGNLVDDIREAEDEGWDGPSVMQWGKSVKEVNAALAAAEADGA